MNITQLVQILYRPKYKKLTYYWTRKKNVKDIEEPRFQMNENVTELVMRSLQNEMEEGRRFSNEEKEPMTLKD